MYDEIAIATAQRGWETLSPVLDATASAADITLAVGERDFLGARALTSNFCYYKVPEGVNAIEVRFKSTTNDHDVDIDVWAARDLNDEMARVCTLDVIIGQQDAAGATLHFADTINISNNKWLKTVYAVEPGTDHLARLVFDTCGYKYIGFHGFGTFDGDITVEVSGP